MTDPTSLLNRTELLFLVIEDGQFLYDGGNLRTFSLNPQSRKASVRDTIDGNGQVTVFFSKTDFMFNTEFHCVNTNLSLTLSSIL